MILYIIYIYVIFYIIYLIFIILINYIIKWWLWVVWKFIFNEVGIWGISNSTRGQNRKFISLSLVIHLITQLIQCNECHIIISDWYHIMQWNSHHEIKPNNPNMWSTSLHMTTDVLGATKHSIRSRIYQHA